jgi:hypothetical protein
MSITDCSCLGVFRAPDLLFFTPAGSAGTADALDRHTIGTLSLRLTLVSDGAPSAVFQLEDLGRLHVRIGSYLAVPLTSGGGLLSGAKLKKEDQKLTLGFEGRLAPAKQPCSAATSNARL